MRPLYEEFDDFDFADSAVVERVLRAKQREQRRLAARRFHGPGDEESFDDHAPRDVTDKFDDDDYDDDDFDAYSGLDLEP